MEKRRQTSDSAVAVAMRTLENDRRIYVDERAEYEARCERGNRYARFYTKGRRARRLLNLIDGYVPDIPEDLMDAGAYMDGWRYEELKINDERRNFGITEVVIAAIGLYVAVVCFLGTVAHG